MANGGSVVLVEDITERKNAEAKINHLARYDALTGLPNRTFFRDQMDARARGDAARGAIAPSSSSTSTSSSRSTTRSAIPAATSCCARSPSGCASIVRDTDVVARFGGDEFVVLQTRCATPRKPRPWPSASSTRLASTYDIDGHQVVDRRQHRHRDWRRATAADADMLLKNADMALYRAKADGRGAWRFFEPEMDVKAQARRNLELDLRNALATDAFEVYYQPLLNLKTKRISTCEALLRWPHPERGMISPAEFIPVAEEMGLIVEIGNWVLRKACLECAQWPDDVRVAVNLSPIQFRRGNVATPSARRSRPPDLPPTGSRSRSPSRCCCRTPKRTRRWL